MKVFTIGFCTFLLLVKLSVASHSDSLRQALSQTSDPQEQSLIFSRIAKSMEHQNTDSAIFFARKGYEIGQKAGDEICMAENAAVLGDLFVISNQLEKAKEQYLLASQFFQAGKQDFPYCQILMVLGNIFLTQGEYFEAHQNYQESLEIALKNGFDEILPHLYNNIGVIYLDLKDLEGALPYFENALKLFKEQQDEYNVAFISANLAFIYGEQGEDEKALALYMEMLPTFIKLKNWLNLVDTHDRIARFYLDRGNIPQAKEHITTAYQIFQNRSYTFSGPSSLTQTRVLGTLAEVALKEKDFEKALAFARKSFDLGVENFYQENIVTAAELVSRAFEQLGQTDSSLHYLKHYVDYSEGLERAESLKNVTQQKLQREFSSKLRQAELEKLRAEAEHKQREYTYIVLLVFALLSALILILLYRSQRIKALTATLRKEKLELEKENLNQEIHYKNKELTTNMMYLFEKNEFITYIARKLDEIKPEAKRENKVLIQQIINELKKNSSQSAWDEFELRFMEVHADFYESLNQAYPDLTPNEKKLCAFLRLNMTTKEISAITHQSLQSINMARFRLRKKMGMERDENLVSFLSQL